MHQVFEIDRSEEGFRLQEIQMHAALTRTGFRWDSCHGRSSGYWSKLWQVNLLNTESNSGTCQCSGCPYPAVSRIFMNVWGCGYEVNVCKTHESRHRNWVDSI